MHETMGRFYRELKDPIKMRGMLTYKPKTLNNSLPYLPTYLYSSD